MYGVNLGILSSFKKENYYLEQVGWGTGPTYPLQFPLLEAGNELEPRNILRSKSFPFQSFLQSLEGVRRNHDQVSTRFQELWIYAFYLFSHFILQNPCRGRYKQLLVSDKETDSEIAIFCKRRCRSSPPRALLTFIVSSLLVNVTSAFPWHPPLILQLSLEQIANIYLWLINWQSILSITILYF